MLCTEKILYQATYLSPIGLLLFESTDDAILACYFVEEGEYPKISPKKTQQPLLKACITQLDGYFQGKQFTFELPLFLESTPFTHQVWQQIQRIPYANTASYRSIAHAVGRPKAVRAVGQASHRNPIGIIVPCHRVIGSRGNLVGYAGGLWRKAWLLKHEQSHQDLAGLV